MKVLDCIFFQLNRAGRAGAGFWAKKVEHLGVTASQAMVLNLLAEEDRIPFHSLVGKLEISGATLTGILDRLEKMALVERTPHPEDRRAVLVCLTEPGLSLAQELQSIMVEANHDFLARLAPGEAETLRSILKQL